MNLTAGDTARIRVVNAGFLTHNVHVHGTDVRILATDGHDVAGGAAINAPVPVAAGERLDLGFTVPSGSWSIDWHDGTSAARQITIPLTATASLHLNEGSTGAMNTGGMPGMAMGGSQFTINGKVSQTPLPSKSISATRSS